MLATVFAYQLFLTFFTGRKRIILSNVGTNALIW